MQAVTVKPNEFWIVKDQERKCGTLEATTSGFALKINNTVTNFKTLRMVKKDTGVVFDEPQVKRVRRQSIPREVYGYPSDGPAYNALFDVQKRLPIYTREAKSKSWYAAGWYMVKQGSRYRPQFCPKLITLQRYSYVGPVRHESELVLQ